MNQHDAIQALQEARDYAAGEGYGMVTLREARTILIGMTREEQDAALLEGARRQAFRLIMETAPYRRTRDDLDAQIVEPQVHRPGKASLPETRYGYIG